MPKRTRNVRLAIAAACYLPVMGSAFGQQAATKQAAPGAALYRVTEGVFALRPGQSIDLTDRKILLAVAFQQLSNQLGQGNANITINGGGYSVHAGTRIDLKRGLSTAKTVSDKSSCDLDVTDVATPHGAPPTITFRLNCL